MDHSAIEDFICQTVELLKTHGTTKFALSLNFRGSIYAEDGSVEIPSKFAHVLFDASRHSIGVWACVTTDKFRVHDVQDNEWKFYSHHDSCWRSDGMRWIFETYIAMRDDLAAKVKRKMPGYFTNVYEINSRITCNPTMTWFHKVEFESTHKNFEYSISNVKVLQ